MDNNVRIAVLHRGWVIVGRVSRDGDVCVFTGCAVVRRWGTTCGLGELAERGPTTNTVLDPQGTTRVPFLGVVMTIECNPQAWAGRLPA